MTRDYKLIAICLLFFFVATSYSFFISSKDLRKMLRIFPKAFEVENTQKSRPLQLPRPENIYQYDDYDRYDNGGNRRNTNRNSKGKVNGRYDHKQVYTNKDREGHYHSHPHDCDHPDHQHHQGRYPSDNNQGKYPEDRVEKYNVKNSKYGGSEEISDYSQNDRRNNQDSKKITPKDEKEYTDSSEKNIYDKRGKNKDYVTGILVTIPKIKDNGDDLNSYYKESKQQNSFLHHLLKTEEDDHQPEESYLY